MIKDVDVSDDFVADEETSGNVEEKEVHAHVEERTNKYK